MPAIQAKYKYKMSKFLYLSSTASVFPPLLKTKTKNANSELQKIKK